MQIINHISYYDDQPEVVQEHSLGILIDEKFTGVVEHGGKYRDTYYFINDHELSRDPGGDDVLDTMVKTAIEGAIESSQVEYPKLDEVFEYTFNEESGQPERILTEGAETKLVCKLTVNL